MTHAVVACALLVAALNGIAGLLGGWLWSHPSAPLLATAAEPGARGANGGLSQSGESGPGGRSRRGPESVFWVALRVGQGSALALAIAVGSLAAAGRHSSEHLFYLYALLPLAVGFIAEQLRLTAAQTVLDQRGLLDAQALGALPQAEQLAVVAAIVHRELGVMALSALVVVFLALRAASTAHGF